MKNIFGKGKGSYASTMRDQDEVSLRKIGNKYQIQSEVKDLIEQIGKSKNFIKINGVM